MRKVFLPFLIITYCFSCFAAEDKLLLISSKDEGYASIAPHAYFLEDKTGKVTIKDLISNPERFLFKQIKKDKKDLGFTTSVYWVKFKILYSGTAPKDFYIEAARPVTNVAELYQYESNGEISVKYSGDGIAYKNKDVPHRNTVFKVTLFPSQVNTFYLKVASDGEALNIPVKIWTPDSFGEKDYKEQYILGLYYGILLFVSLIYFFFYVALKERSFIYYVLYVLGIAILQFSLDGYSSQVLFENNVWLANHIVLMSAAFGLFFLLAYVRSFLNTSLRTPSLDVVFKCLIVLDIICFLFLFTNGKLYELSYPLINVLSLAGTISVFVAIVRIMRLRIHVCPYFISAFVFLMTGICIFILNNLNIIPSSFLTENGMKLGTGIEVIFLSFSMANRFKDLQKAKERAQAEALEKLEEMNQLKDKININLETQVKERTKEINLQKEVIEQKNKDITDSINYAKGIQQATLTDTAEFFEIFPDAFVIFRPKDIVSGDFYWFARLNDTFLIAAADCTGHGVPGALMSMIGNSFLNEIVNEKKISVPSEILFELRERVIRILNQQRNEIEKNDGMDISLVSIDLKKNMLQFAGAYNPLWIIRGGEFSEIKGSKFPIGKFQGKENENFANHELKLEKGDCVYLFSDGYADQFGGTQGKKFKYQQLKNLLLSISGKSMSEQKDLLNLTLDNWKGVTEQVDDILFIGFKA
jgi:two-component system, sensor histidine kinase LadS